MRNEPAFIQSLGDAYTLTNTLEDSLSDLNELQQAVIARLAYLRDACQQSADLEWRAYAVNVGNALLHLKGEISAPDAEDSN